MKTQCPHCQAYFNIKPNYVGKRTKCKNCGRPYLIAIVANFIPAACDPVPAEITSFANLTAYLTDQSPVSPGSPAAATVLTSTADEASPPDLQAAEEFSVPEAPVQAAEEFSAPEAPAPAADEIRENISSPELEDDLAAALVENILVEDRPAFEEAVGLAEIKIDAQEPLEIPDIRMVEEELPEIPDVQMMTEEPLEIPDVTIIMEEPLEIPDVQVAADDPVETIDFQPSAAETAVAAEEAEVPTETPAIAEEAETPAETPMVAEEAEAPAETPMIAEEAEAPAETPMVAEEAETPAETPMIAEEAEAPAETPMVAEEAEAPAETPMVAEEAETPAETPMVAEEADTLTEAPMAAEEAEAPAETPVVAEEAEAPAETPVVAEEAEAPAKTPMAAEEAEVPAETQVVAEKSPAPAMVPAARAESFEVSEIKTVAKALAKNLDALAVVDSLETENSAAEAGVVQPVAARPLVRAAVKPSVSPAAQLPAQPMVKAPVQPSAIRIQAQANARPATPPSADRTQVQPQVKTPAQPATIRTQAQPQAIRAQAQPSATRVPVQPVAEPAKAAAQPNIQQAAAIPSFRPAAGQSAAYGQMAFSAPAFQQPAGFAGAGVGYGASGQSPVSLTGCHIPPQVAAVISGYPASSPWSGGSPTLRFGRRLSGHAVARPGFSGSTALAPPREAPEFDPDDGLIDRLLKQMSPAIWVALAVALVIGLLLGAKFSGVLGQSEAGRLRSDAVVTEKQLKADREAKVKELKRERQRLQTDLSRLATHTQDYPEGSIPRALAVAASEEFKIADALLLQQIAAIESGAKVTLTVNQTKPDPELAATLEGEMVRLEEEISRQWQAVRGLSDKPRMLATTGVATQLVNLAILNRNHLIAKYGLSAPVPLQYRASAPGSAASAKTIPAGPGDDGAYSSEIRRLQKENEHLRAENDLLLNSDSTVYASAVNDLGLGRLASAEEKFSRLLKMFPASPLAGKAQEGLAEIRTKTAEREALKRSPVEIMATGVKHDGGYFRNQSYVRISFKNVSKLMIKRVEFTILTFDEHGYPIASKRLDITQDNFFTAALTENIPAGRSDYGVWELSEKVRQVKVRLKTVEFYDASAWRDEDTERWVVKEGTRFQPRGKGR